MTASLRSGSTSPESIRLPTPTADDFPTPAGQIFNVTKRDQGLISPAQSSFSFPDEDHPAHAISTTPDLLYEKPISRHLGRGAPGDGALLSKTNGSPLQVELRKKRSQFYGDVFAYREPNLSPRDRIYKDSVITAEVKTNVIVCVPSCCSSPRPVPKLISSFAAPDKRRIRFPSRLFSTAIPKIPKTYLIDRHHPQSFRLPLLRWNLRLCLRLDNQRLAFPNTSHNK